MKEKRNVNILLNQEFTSKEISDRKTLVDWMCDIGDTFKLTAETTHKAVSYFDRIASENHLKENEHKPIALICILLAAKLTERDPAVNSVVSLFRKTIGNHKLNIMQYEGQIMDQLNWDLQRVTAIEFIKFFTSQGIVFNNDLVNWAVPNEKAIKSLRQYAEFFADLCLQEYEFISADSLILAAGVIAAARKTLKFQKTWNKELEELVTVRKEEAEKYAEAILKKYEMLFPKNTQSKGVSSSARSNVSAQYSIKRYMIKV